MICKSKPLRDPAPLVRWYLDLPLSSDLTVTAAAASLATYRPYLSEISPLIAVIHKFITLRLCLLASSSHQVSLIDTEWLAREQYPAQRRSFRKFNLVQIVPLLIEITQITSLCVRAHHIFLLSSIGLPLQSQERGQSGGEASPSPSFSIKNQDELFYRL